MKVRYGFEFLLLICAMAVTGCGNDQNPAAITSTTVKKAVVMDPFRFHKMIEVSPGEDYDVLSWGRGSTATGSFLILHSDSAAKKFTTTTGDLDGEIVDVYNSDMDLDGNPEILIQVKVNDTINYNKIYAFEFKDDKAEKLDFPKLTKAQRQGYRGGDNYYVKEGVLIREFPVYDGSGKNAKPSGQKRRYEYGLRNNNFTIKQLLTDTVNAGKAKTALQVPAKKVTTPKAPSTDTQQSAHHKKSKKHTGEVKHKKKHKRHHHSDGG